MSKRNHGQSNRSESSLGRRRLARRSSVLVEALEKRRLLSSVQPYTWTNTGIGGTGTDYHANMNPENPQDIYVDTDMGEVWHTTNDGLTWATINEFTGLRGDANQNFQSSIHQRPKHAVRHQPCYQRADGNHR